MANKNKCASIKKNAKRKRLIGLFSLTAISLLSITSVVSCSSTQQGDQVPANINVLNTNNGTDGFANNNAFDVQNIAKQALLNSDGQNAFLNSLANQIVYQWFLKNTNSTIQNQFKTAQTNATNSFNQAVNKLKKQYPNSWQYYVQNNLYAPNGGTETSYKNSLLYSTLMSDFINDVTFNTQSSTSQQPGIWGNINFAQITTGSTHSFFENNNTGLGSVSSNTTFDQSQKLANFVNQTSNWAPNGNNNEALTFFPTGFYSPLNYQYDNFLTFLFDQWVINTNPFITVAATFESNLQTSKGSTGTASYAPIYNSSYFNSALSQSSNTFNVAFPYFGTSSSVSNQNFLKFYNSLQNLNNGVDQTVNSWTQNASVYSSVTPSSSSTVYNTGGIYLQNYSQAANQDAYLINTIGSNNSASQELTGFALPYLSAAYNRYNVLLNDTNSQYFNNDTGIGYQIPNGILSTSLSSNLLSNFLYQSTYISQDDTTTSSANPFNSSYKSIPLWQTSSMNENSKEVYLLNPQTTQLLYNGQPLTPSTFSDFWNYNQPNNYYDQDNTSISTFNVLYNANNNLTLSPFVFVRDSFGAQVLAIDGYSRILQAATQKNSDGTYAIASPLDVYPNPSNAYEAEVDAIAQDLMWRQMQVIDSVSGYKSITLSKGKGIASDLSQYLKANESALIILYALQANQPNLSSSNSNLINNSAYNPLFSNQYGYNLFGSTLSSLFDKATTQALENLVICIVSEQMYLIDQNNQNTLKGRFNTWAMQFVSSYTSSNNTSIENAYAYFGTTAALPYFTNLNSSYQYPYLSLALYQPYFSNTLGFGSYNISSSSSNSNQLESINYYASLIDNSNGQSLINNINNQLSSYNNKLNDAINSFFTSIDLKALNLSNSSNAYGKFVQNIYVNNQAVNAAINASITKNDITYYVKNNILANALGINLTNQQGNNLSAISDLNTSNLSKNSVFNNPTFSAQDNAYSSSANIYSMLQTAVLYEYYAQNNIVNKPSNFTLYGYNLPSSSNSYYPQSQTDSLQDPIGNLTNSFMNYLNYANNSYSNNNFANSSSMYNYLTLLNTVNYLYDGGSWNNLRIYLQQQLSDGPLYVVWANGDDTSYMNQQNGWFNNSVYSNNQNSSNAQNTQSSSYNTSGVAYGTIGYSNNVLKYGYAPFNYIPYPNLNGQIWNQFMTPSISNSAVPFSSAKTAYNNITSFNSSLSNYFNIANVNLAVNSSSTNSTIVSTPFTGFYGLMTTSNSSKDSYINSALFTNNTQYTIGGWGTLSNYTGGLGLDPATTSFKNQPAGSLMSAILSATNYSTLINISNQLQNANGQIPQFTTVNIQGSSSNPSNSVQQNTNQYYAQNVFNYLNKLGSSIYSNYFLPFDGYVTSCYDNEPSGSNYFNNLTDFYEVVSGGSNLQYNNPYNQTTLNKMQSLLTTAEWNAITGSSQSTDAANLKTLYSDIQTARTINNGSLTCNVYAAQITQSMLEPNLNNKNATAWTNNTWSNNNSIWKNFNLTQDAFIKMIVQLSANATLQQQALSSVLNANNGANKVTVYDNNLKTALGILWVLNWYNN